MEFTQRALGAFVVGNAARQNQSGDNALLEAIMRPPAGQAARDAEMLRILGLN